MIDPLGFFSPILHTKGTTLVTREGRRILFSKPLEMSTTTITTTVVLPTTASLSPSGTTGVPPPVAPPLTTSPSTTVPRTSSASMAPLSSPSTTSQPSPASPPASGSLSPDDPILYAVIAIAIILAVLIVMVIKRRLVRSFSLDAIAYYHATVIDRVKELDSRLAARCVRVKARLVQRFDAPALLTSTPSDLRRADLTTLAGGAHDATAPLRLRSPGSVLSLMPEWIHEAIELSKLDAAAPSSSHDAARSARAAADTTTLPDEDTSRIVRQFRGSRYLCWLSDVVLNAGMADFFSTTAKSVVAAIEQEVEAVKPLLFDRALLRPVLLYDDTPAAATSGPSDLDASKASTVPLSSASSISNDFSQDVYSCSFVACFFRRDKQHEAEQAFAEFLDRLTTALVGHRSAVQAAVDRHWLSAKLAKLVANVEATTATTPQRSSHNDGPVGGNIGTSTPSVVEMAASSVTASDMAPKFTISCAPATRQLRLDIWNYLRLLQITFWRIEGVDDRPYFGCLDRLCDMESLLQTCTGQTVSAFTAMVLDRKCREMLEHVQLLCDTHMEYELPPILLRWREASRSAKKSRNSGSSAAVNRQRQQRSGDDAEKPLRDALLQGAVSKTAADAQNTSDVAGGAPFVVWDDPTVSATVSELKRIASEESCAVMGDPPQEPDAPLGPPGRSQSGSHHCFISMLQPSQVVARLGRSWRLQRPLGPTGVAMTTGSGTVHGEVDVTVANSSRRHEGSGGSGGRSSDRASLWWTRERNDFVYTVHRHMQRLFGGQAAGTEAYEGESWRSWIALGDDELFLEGANGDDNHRGNGEGGVRVAPAGAGGGIYSPREEGIAAPSAPRDGLGVRPPILPTAGVLRAKAPFTSVEECVAEWKDYFAQQLLFSGDYVPSASDAAGATSGSQAPSGVPLGMDDELRCPNAVRARWWELGKEDVVDAVTASSRGSFSTRGVHDHARSAAAATENGIARPPPGAFITPPALLLDEEAMMSTPRAARAAASR